MPQVINTNIASLNAQRNLNVSQNSLSTALQRLSSGLRINSAKDDAAGLAISESMTSQIRGMNQAARNANDGISLAQTAEGALVEVSNNLQRIRELAVQAANGIYSAEDRDAIDVEVKQLTEEIIRIGTSTKFNSTPLLGADFDGASEINFQVGANSDSDNQIKIGVILDVSTMVADDAAFTVAGDGSEALTAIDAVDEALKTVNSARADLGAIQNRFSSAITSLQTNSENLSASRSRIQDADFAAETAALTRAQILQQAGVAMLSQANALPNNVLSLLR
ncbi:MAG TPA: flagellin [Nitrosomonas europaea]|nr:flagellin [Nitrosomonas europaea]